MATEEYAVDAHLRILTGGADTALTRLGGRIQSLGRGIAGTGQSASSTLRSLVGFGAAYAGVNMLVGGFQALTGWAVQYQRQLEQMSISLAAVISATDNIPFEAARQQSGRLFDEMREDALVSVATTSELFGVAQMIYGPLHGAGQGMEEIRNFTRDTVTAATALGIPLDMAGREMNMLVNGSAGMHNRLYAMLHATGAIAEDAHEWNQLTTGERVERLGTALGRFSTAADAYGHSFAGVASTFQDIVEQFSSNLFAASFDRLRAFMQSLNDRLLANRDSIVSTLTMVGEFAADRLETAFDHILNGIDYVGAHWDEMLSTAQAFIGRVEAVIPMLQEAAQMWVGISVARSVVGGGIAAGGGLMSLLGGMGVSLPGAALVGTTAAGGAGAAAAGGAAAATSVFAPLMAALSPLLPLIIPLAAAFALVASMVYAVSEHFQIFSAALDNVWPLVQQIGNDLMGLGGDLWAAIEPIMELIGFGAASDAVGSLASFLSTLHLIIDAIRHLTIYLRDLGQWIHSYTDPAIERMGANMLKLTGTLGDIAPRARSASDALYTLLDPLAELAGQIGTGTDLGAELGDSGMTRMFGRFTGGSSRTPTTRAQTINDFSGSRISIQQEFREADPDRVLMQIMDDISSQAESRITSGFASPLTR